MVICNKLKFRNITGFEILYLVNHALFLNVHKAGAVRKG